MVGPAGSSAWSVRQKVLRGTNRTLKKKAVVAIGGQLMVDLWRMETGGVRAEELNLVMFGA